MVRDREAGTDLAAEKARLRAHFEAARRAVPEPERAAVHAALVARVRMLPEVRAARTVHVFWPLLARGEVDTRPLIAALHAESRRVVLPVVLLASRGGAGASAGGSVTSERGLEASAAGAQGAGGGLEASGPALGEGARRAPALVHRLYEGEAALIPGPWGLREPSAQAPEVSPEEIDVVLVPALAADRQGHRLGYGAGFYDAFLAQTEAFTVGLVPDGCLVDALPYEPHDVALGAVVTERETVRPRLSLRNPSPPKP